MIESINNISNTTEGNSCRIMIVDHDPTNILVTELIIRKVIKNPQIKSFTIPHLALNYIEEEHGKAERKMPTLLLLDLYLPGTESYEFLDNFSSLRTNIREQFKIVALTSSIDRKEKAKSNELSLRDRLSNKTSYKGSFTAVNWEIQFFFVRSCRQFKIQIPKSFSVFNKSRRKLYSSYLQPRRFPMLQDNAHLIF